MHINVLEVTAAFIGVRTYCHCRSYKHVRVMSDSSTAIAYTNNKGGIKSKKYNEIVKEIRLWYFKNNSLISATHIPGKHNIEADKFSRKLNNNTEWQLNPKILAEVINTFGYPEIDIFATRINTQLQNYGSCSCEPEAKAVDAFLTDWGKQFSCIFPPFSFLGKVTSNMWREKARRIVIIPKWTTQYWYPVIMEMAISEITIKLAPDSLLLPQDKRKLHPLHKNLTLAAVLIQWK